MDVHLQTQTAMAEKSLPVTGPTRARTKHSKADSQPEGHCTFSANTEGSGSHSSRWVTDETCTPFAVQADARCQLEVWSENLPFLVFKERMGRDSQLNLGWTVEEGEAHLGTLLEKAHKKFNSATCG